MFDRFEMLIYILLLPSLLLLLCLGLIFLFLQVHLHYLSFFHLFFLPVFVLSAVCHHLFPKRVFFLPMPDNILCLFDLYTLKPVFFPHYIQLQFCFLLFCLLLLHFLYLSLLYYLYPLYSSSIRNSFSLHLHRHRSSLLPENSAIPFHRYLFFRFSLPVHSFLYYLLLFFPMQMPVNLLCLLLNIPPQAYLSVFEIH